MTRLPNIVLYACVCVRARACVRVCVHTCVRACACVYEWGRGSLDLYVSNSHRHGMPGMN